MKFKLKYEVEESLYRTIIVSDIEKLDTIRRYLEVNDTDAVLRYLDVPNVQVVDMKLKLTNLHTIASTIKNYIK